MSFVEVVSLIVFVLAGALFGYKAWVQKAPIPNPPPGAETPGDSEYRAPVFPLEGPEPPSAPPTDPGH